MMVSVKKGGLSVPKSIAQKAGIRPGDVVEFAVRQGAITIHAATQEPERRHAAYTPTKAEAAAIRKGRAAYKRGEFVTLSQLHGELDAARRQPRKKITPKAS